MAIPCPVWWLAKRVEVEWRSGQKPVELTAVVSPFGPLAAEAQNEGYKKGSGTDPQPFHGYFFKILKRRRKHAPGGKHDDVINGNMIAGFGLVAWPAEYGQTVVMTFIVNQQGRVYQRDLGAETASKAAAMKEYDPDRSWKPSAD